MGSSVAFKCTYCNGGENPYVGFTDTCSDEIIKYNIENNHIWCNNSECRDYYDNGRLGKRPKNPCHESVLFKEWEFGAGGYQNGKRKGTLIPLVNAEKGKLAIITTRFPDEDVENKRRIIGLYRIGKIIDNNLLVANSKDKIRLPLEEARQLYFWSYCTNKLKKPKWGSGLFRYLNDEQVHRILVDVADTVRDEKTKYSVLTLIKELYGNKKAPPANGCLSSKSDERRSVIGYKRKYGPFGEGEAHKKLKKWIATHPSKLKIPPVSSVKIESPFISGDVADIVFKHTDGSWTVVEIETNFPLPGSYQAIKYKALLCAEQGLPLNTGRVRTFLVAWSIPHDLCNFCDKYGVKYYEKRI